LNGKII